MLVSNGASVLSFSRVAASILANASSVGAITVNSPPLRVSTRFTPGLSLPETAAVSVVSIGLFEAAVATGSLAMPATGALRNLLGVGGAAAADQAGGGIGGSGHGRARGAAHRAGGDAAGTAGYGARGAARFLAGARGRAE